MPYNPNLQSPINPMSLASTPAPAIPAPARTEPVLSPIAPVVPMAQPMLTPVSKLAVSGGPAGNEFKGLSNDVTNAIATANAAMPGTVPGAPTKPTPKATQTYGQGDAYSQMLDKQMTTSDDATKAMISTIQAQRAQRGMTIDAQYDNYKRGLQSLGILHNQAQATPDLLLGHIQQAENEHQAKLQQLDVEVNKALMDARKAQADGNLSVLKEKMRYQKELKDEQKNILKDIASEMNAEATIAEHIVASVYDELQNVAPDKQEEFLQKVVRANPQISLGSLVASVTKEKERRDKEALAKRNTESLIADRNKPAAAPKLTLSEKKDNVYADINKLLSPKTKDSNGVPYIDDNGYITPSAFKSLIAAAREDNISRTEFLSQYGDMLYPDDLKAYGLTPKEQKGLAPEE